MKFNGADDGVVGVAHDKATSAGRERHEAAEARWLAAFLDGPTRTRWSAFHRRSATELAISNCQTRPVGSGNSASGPRPGQCTLCSSATSAARACRSDGIDCVMSSQQ